MFRLLIVDRIFGKEKRGWSFSAAGISFLQSRDPAGGCTPYTTPQHIPSLLHADWFMEAVLHQGVTETALCAALTVLWRLYSIKEDEGGCNL